jgi:aerobic carbon-monoxide dehydrogenase large subunit
MAGKFGIGQSVSRTEDPRLLRGQGTFVDDIRLPGMAYAHVVRSPHAHARIRKIDTAAAKAAPGVLAVLTGADAAEDRLGGFVTMGLHPNIAKDARLPSQPILQREFARHVGDRIALVVAETADRARDAAEAIGIDWEVLPAVTSIEAAQAPGAPKVWADAPDNFCFRAEMGDKRAVDAAFARAAHKVRARIVHNRISANSMEPRTTLAAYDPVARRTTLYVSHQAPHRLKQALAADVLHIPEADLRVVAPEVGGGFGMKSQLYPEDALVAWAAGKLGRPVKWVGERAESLMSDTHARDRIDEGEMAFDADGRILAIRYRMEAAVGAYISASGSVPPMQTLRLLSSVYRIPALYGAARAWFSHTNPMAVYRGAGRPEAMMMVERLIEDGAKAAGIDAAELRRRNFIAPAAMPYQTHSDLNYDSGEFAAILDTALRNIDRRGFAARRAESERKGKLRGFGIGQYIELSGQMNERMGLRIEADGTVLVFSGTFSHGQGHETVYAQIVSDWLGVPFDKVRLVQGDTDRVAGGRGTFGARSMVCAGGALRNAADQVIEKGKRFAAQLLEASAEDMEFEGGAFRVAGTDRTVPLSAVARASHAPAGPLAAIGMGLEAVGNYDPVPSCPNGCHAVEVEIDPETGRIEIVRYVAVDDVGVALNPMLVDGQVHGGIAQGVGQVLMEEIVYDPETGQLLSGSFLDYAMPRADDLPAIDVALHCVPAKTNPLGVKGVGEAGTVGALPAVMNAIRNALSPLGVTDVAMPTTPERVWRAIRDARAA